MEQTRQSEKAVMRAARAAFVRGPFSAKELGTDSIPEARIRKWCDGEKPVRCWEVRELLPDLVRRDPGAALNLVTDLLGLRDAGLVLSLGSKATPGARDLVVEATEVGAVVGRLQAEVLEAAEDNVVSTDERTRVARAIAETERQVAETRAVLARISEPQLALAVGGTR